MIVLLFTVLIVRAERNIETIIPILSNECWWGGMVGKATSMPFKSDEKTYDLSKENFNNQNVPFLVSSLGRYIWNENPFRFKIKNDSLFIYSDYEKIELVESGSNLREAFLTASNKHFPSDRKIPEEIFFSQPQYNTWIELMYNQNQKQILEYAESVLKFGFPTGIFMIDDNWQKYYGSFDFKPEKFEDAKAMTDSLHKLGFKVMLWISPFYSPDSPEFREMRDLGYLLKNKTDGSPAIIKWWNGYSACLDVTNQKAVDHFISLLSDTQKKYNIDGFKFDAGDIVYMSGDYSYHDKNANANIFSQKWAEIGLEFPFNELRTTWKTGGKPLVQRLGDKAYSWNSNKSLIPGMITAGLMGFSYTCPDMIGGGEYKSFLNASNKTIDEELIVRSCQIHALMPMMQFSVAPWRVLGEKNREICAKYAKLHENMGPYILQCARYSSETGEPIVRSMEYSFPHQGFLYCTDQYMLGDKYLVAPMVNKGYQRTVLLPKGKWKDETGKIYKGGKSIIIDVPIERLPYFEKLK